MRTLRYAAVISALISVAPAADVVTYTNFIRQTQLPSNVSWDASSAVEESGTRLSDLVINPGGARFDLWTIKSAPLTSYLLDTVYVGTYVPLATVAIRSEDPYPLIKRTRADRPFWVDVTVSGLLTGASDPEASKAVKLLRHVQSYGAGGTGIGIDRSQATMFSQSTIETNGTHGLSYTITSVPGANRLKVRGEERFSVFSLTDSRISEGLSYHVGETQISSDFIQIWPVANGLISGITPNQSYRFKVPAITFTLNDLYPQSTTYAQVYKGPSAIGTVGTVVPGSSLVVDDSQPVDRVLVVDDLSTVFDSDGTWTMELLTSTPFGIDRLAHVTFDLNLTISVNGTVTTVE